MVVAIRLAGIRLMPVTARCRPGSPRHGDMVSPSRNSRRLSRFVRLEEGQRRPLPLAGAVIEQHRDRLTSCRLWLAGYDISSTTGANGATRSVDAWEDGEVVVISTDQTWNVERSMITPETTTEWYSTIPVSGSAAVPGAVQCRRLMQT